MEWQQSGEWLHDTSGRFKIARMDLWQGRTYSLYDWDADLPKLIAVRDTAEAAKKLAIGLGER